jgi:hypothetical protein
MSQHDDTLRQSLQQHFEELQETQEANDLLRNIVEWILQELIELKFLSEMFSPSVNCH